MDFISMDLIGEFHPPSSQGNKVCPDSYLHAIRLDLVHPYTG